MCRKAQRTLGGSCQVASVTRLSASGGNPHHAVGDLCQGWVPACCDSALRSRYPSALDYASAMLTPGDPLRRDASATAANWQDPPFNRWAFWHVRELLPDPPDRRGGDGRVRGRSRTTPTTTTCAPSRSTRVDGSRATVADVLDDTFTDA